MYQQSQISQGLGRKFRVGEKRVQGFNLGDGLKSELYVRSRYASTSEEVNVLRKYPLRVS